VERQPGYLSATGTAGEGRLKIQTRKVRPPDNTFTRSDTFDSREFRACGRMRLEVDEARRWNRGERRKAIARWFDGGAGGAKGVSQGCHCNLGGLQGLTQLIPGNRQLGLRPRLVGPRSELILDERSNGVGKHL